MWLNREGKVLSALPQEREVKFLRKILLGEGGSLRTVEVNLEG